MYVSPTITCSWPPARCSTCMLPSPAAPHNKLVNTGLHIPTRHIRRSGFARFTNARFSMRKEDISNTFVHLTNVAIQKHAPGFDKAKGMKWPIRSLRLFMQTRHGGLCANIPSALPPCFAMLLQHRRRMHGLHMHTMKHTHEHAGADANNELFGAIQALIVRTLLAVQPAMINDKHCFEVRAAHACGACPPLAKKQSTQRHDLHSP